MLIAGIDRLFVGPTATLREAIEVIDHAELQIALVIDDSGRLLGTISDGDVRRALLRGATLDEAAQGVMFTSPLTVDPAATAAAVEALMKRTGLRRIPIVDESGVVVGLAVPRSEARFRGDSNLVVIMAGGLGTRLAELTKDRPKPLLEVGHKPMLETIIERFVLQGFDRILIAVNYKADMIEDYFGDGAKYGASIEYIRENKRLGTAGALTHLPPGHTSPIIVVNGDVLTTIDFRKMLSFHKDAGRLATMGVTFYDVHVPYGVVEVTDQQVNGLVEKPVYRYFVNAGIYVLDPACVNHLESNEYADMTTLFEKLLSAGHKVTSYPIHEYWQDVGRPDDLERAKREFESVFAPSR